MKKEETIGGFIWFALGTGICIGSIYLKLGNLHKPGPGFMPLLSGALLAVLGLSLILRSIPKKSSTEGEIKARCKSNSKKLLPYILALLGYLLFLNILGFLLTTVIFLFVLFKLTDQKRIMMPLGLAIGSSVVSYLIFWVWLKCPLPKGLFFKF